MTRISILLPTYNGARYLREQVDSIRQQTMNDWRLLIADDGSTDGTQAICREFAEKDSRIQIIPSHGNIGQRRRLRQLGDIVDTEFIAIADQDDVWQNDKLKLLAEHIVDADMAFGPSHLVDGSGKDLGRLLTDNLPPRHIAGERLGLLFRPLVSAHAMLARRHLLNEKNLDRWLPFDWLMSIEAAFGKGLIYVPEAITRHRMHDTNQANGEFAQLRPRSPLVSRGMLKVVRRAREADRGHFMRMAERLQYADGVSEDVRYRFGKALTLADDSWYGRWHDRRISAAETIAGMNELLGPLAGNEDDWRYAELRIRALSLPLYSPTRFVNRHQRLKYERER